MFKAGLRFIIVVIICVLLARKAGDYLVVEQVHKADVIVILSGDNNDVRLNRGLELLRQGYSSTMLLDASDDTWSFGETAADGARRFIEKDPTMAQHVKVCPIRRDSTDAETKYVESCIRNAQSVMLVTSDYHTRRALAIFRKRVPNHVFYVAAASNPYAFGRRWWERREWAKTTVMEWEKLLWWELVERWETIRR